MARATFVELLVIMGGNIHHSILLDIEITLSQEDGFFFPCSYLDITGDINHALPGVVA
jgi:hypothetical protein